MKRFLIAAAGAAILCFALVLAAEKPPDASPPSPRVPDMSAAGKVVAISPTELRIERTIKGKAESMLFVLETPPPSIALGSQVKISYREKEGRKILIRVVPAKKTAVQKVKKEVPKKEKAGEAGEGPVTKSP
ncbi:MAG: hypothetical protein AB1558_12930 [Thermodesulfobacteriota bacterium]